MSKIFSRMSFKIAVTVGLAVLAVLILAPRKMAVIRAEQCQNPPTHAVLNSYPLTFDLNSAGCNDLPTLMLKKTTDGNYPLSSSQYGAGVTAHDGETIDVLVYIHNNAVTNGDPNLTVAHNVSAYITVDGNYEPEHVIGATVSSSNTNTATGSMSIHTGSNEHLEVVPGSGQIFNHINQQIGTFTVSGSAVTVNLGDLQPCFDQLKFLHFQVRVVSKQVAPPANNDFSLSVSPTSVCVNSQATFTVANATSGLNGQMIYWSSTKNGVSTGENMAGYNHYVTNGGWSGLSSTYTASDIGSWTKTATIGGVSRSVNFTVQNCGSTVSPSGTITASLGSQVAGQCLWNGTVSWNTAYVNNVQVYVTDPATNTQRLFAATVSGTQNVNWLNPGYLYTFTLKGSNFGDRTATIDTRGLSCATPPPASLVCTPAAQNAATNQIVFFTASGGTGTYSWSAPDGANTGSYGSTFHATYMTAGNKTVTVTSGSQTQTCAVSVTAPSQPNPVSCIASPSSITAGNSVLFSATGGNGSFSWTVNGGSVTSSNQQSFGSQFNNAGTYVATVISGGQSNTCSVTVTQPAQNPLVCSPASQTVNVGQTATFAATGGNGSYTWIASGANLASGSGPTFNTSYPENIVSAGSQITKQVLVTSGSQTQTCNVTVVRQSVPPVVCTANATNVNVGDLVTFNVTGGTGGYNWAAAAANPNSGTGSTFATRFTSPFASRVAVRVANNGANYDCPAITVVQPSQNLTCSIVGSSTVGIDQMVFASASGGNGTYAFNAAGGNPATQAASTNNIFTTRYSAPGSYAINVISGTNVVNCGAVVVASPNNNPVYCTASPSSITAGQSSVFAATGGNGSFSWTVNGGSVTSSNQQSFSSVFNNAGSYTATVTSGGQSNTCNVAVTQQQTQNLVCTIVGSTGVGIDQMVFASASGGNGSYAFNAPGGNPATQASSSNNIFTTRYSSAGGYSINVISDGQVVNCGSITVTAPQQPENPNNNCMYNSCNNNTNTNTNNGGNQNNNDTNINGNNNTVTNINTCVNNSCNTYYINQAGQTVPGNQYGQLSVNKTVRNLYGSGYNSGYSFQDSVSANNGDTVEFQIVVTNTGGVAVNNVRVTDNLPSGLSYVSGTVSQDGGYVSDSFTNGGNMYLGSLNPGQSRTIKFQARVYNGYNQSLQNVAVASGDNVGQVQDDAWVFVQSGSVNGGSVNLNYSKKAWNDTKNADAQSVNASKEDYITYTLTVTNNGNTPANSFVITDDLSQVLPYADVMDAGGGSVSGNVISYPAVTIPAGGSASKSFRVRVKFFLADNLSYVMTNTYGNTVTVRINTPQVEGAFTAPTTGADTMAFTFGGLAVGLFAAFKKRALIAKLILN